MTRLSRARLSLWSMILVVALTLGVATALFFWVQISSPAHVADQAERFSDVMRVVRPGVMLIVLLAWRPAATWLHGRSLVSDRTHRRALAIWPRLSIWSLLIEITLGQGYVVVGLLAAAAYWFLWRLR